MQLEGWDLKEEHPQQREQEEEKVQRQESTTTVQGTARGREKWEVGKRFGQDRDLREFCGEWRSV